MATAVQGVTFAVSDVAPASELLREIPAREAVATFLDGPVEACSHGGATLIPIEGTHPLIAALHQGFSSHRPVILSPDMIWLTICQGLAQHVNQNADRLRPQFLGPGVRKTLTVRRDAFEKGDPDNDWPGVFGEFSERIRDHIGPARDLVVADFSTTGPVERAASEVVLMDAMQCYFLYEVFSLCGIPAITLEGTPQDWWQITERVREFEKFGLGWWLELLLPLLDEFVSAADGDVHREHWQSIYKWQSFSGHSPITGWIVNFFPYTESRWSPHVAEVSPESVPSDRKAVLRRNPFLGGGTTDWRIGPGCEEIPCQPSRVPFQWNIGFPGAEVAFDMEFIGGMLGVSQDPATSGLRPEIGWAIRDTRTLRTSLT